ncbi:MAG TPA: DUF2332 domain-containing protein [Solirubrobacteraceae bacterium]
MLDPSALATRFERFAALEADGHSRLYGRLARAVAADRDLLSLAAHAAPGQPAPNLFLAAVHHLLLGGVEHPLRRFYPSVDGHDRGDPAPAFRDFCRVRWEQLAALLATRRVQTNEVRRSALLVPAIGAAWRRLGERPLALVEVGAAAGLNLGWDRYGYRYVPQGSWGDRASPLQLECEVRGGALPLPARVPPVAWRVGVDVSPIDVRDADATAWLRALIWPDQPERMTRLERAIEMTGRDPPRLVAGDALDVLPGLLEEAPPDAAVCVYHSFTLNQLSAAARERFAALLADVRARRPLAEVAIGGAPPSESGFHPEIRLDGALLGRAEPHAGWIEWAARS